MIGSLAVALGGAAGSVARYWCTLAAARLWGEAFPWGTVLINVAGSLVIGWFATATLPDGPAPATHETRLLVMAGFCGGFTTFSAFSLQTFSFIRAGAWFAASGNVALSVALCVAGVALGHWLALRTG